MNENKIPRPPVVAGAGRGTPENVNFAMLIDIIDILIKRIEKRLPPKRSGYPHAVFVLFQACVQLFGTSATVTSEIINEACRKEGKSFHSFRKLRFTNKKRRRYFPDQPALSRCLKKLSALGLTETFWNEVNFSHLLLLKRLGIIKADINLIADYKKTALSQEHCGPLLLRHQGWKDRAQDLGIFRVIRRVTPSRLCFQDRQAPRQTSHLLGGNPAIAIEWISYQARAP